MASKSSKIDYEIEEIEKKLCDTWESSERVYLLW